MNPEQIKEWEDYCIRESNKELILGLVAWFVIMGIIVGLIKWLL